jgi:hypothetical protein
MKFLSHENKPVEIIPQSKVILKPVWWTEILDICVTPQYLFYDEALRRYRTGSQNTAKKHKWEFTDEEIKELRLDHPDFDEVFMLERHDY